MCLEWSYRSRPRSGSRRKEGKKGSSEEGEGGLEGKRGGKVGVGGRSEGGREVEKKADPGGGKRTVEV